MLGIQICSSRIDVISEACEASETLTCGCPPAVAETAPARGGLRGRGPRRNLLNPRERESMPAETPVTCRCSRPSPERVVLDAHAGESRRQLAAELQCAVALRPSAARSPGVNAVNRLAGEPLHVEVRTRNADHLTIDGARRDVEFVPASLQHRSKASAFGSVVWLRTGHSIGV